jgi:hypothetical protein
MAYNIAPFRTTGSKYFTAAINTISLPITISYLFNKETNTATNGIYVKNTSNGNIYSGTAHTSANQINAFSGIADGSFAQINGSTAYNLNTWNHAAFVDQSASKQLFQNGVSVGTSSVNKTPTGLNEIRIGVYTTSNNFDGSFAEVGIWNAALTAAEIISLSIGMTCDKIRPQNLVFYAPLVRNLQDVKGGRTITNINGATVATHPRVYA